MAVSKPDPKPSRTKIALLIMTAGVALTAVAGYWGYGQIKRLLDAMDCQPSISVEATGSSKMAAELAANAAWETKVAEAYGKDAAVSGLKSNTRLNCSGTADKHTCTYAAQACVWKKQP